VAVIFAATYGAWLFLKSHPDVIVDYFHIDRHETTAPVPLSTATTATATELEGDQPIRGRGVYKWVDAQGGVHYGDTPPAREERASQLRRLDMQPLPEIALVSPAARGEPLTGTPPRPMGGSRLASQDVETEPAGPLCEKATKELETLRARMRAGYRASESGYLLDRERYLRERVAKYCR